MLSLLLHVNNWQHIKLSKLMWLFLSFHGTFESFYLTDETELKQNQLVTILRTLPKEYEISFEIKPTAFLLLWSNIIHLTLSSDNGHYGDRIYGIWINNDVKKIGIFAPTNDEYFSQFTIPLTAISIMEWTKINATQKLINGNYSLNIFIGEVNALSVEIKNPKEYKDVKFYMGNPWYEAQPGYIRNLFTDAISDYFAIKEETALIFNRLVGILTTLPKDYELSFEFKPTQYFFGEWRNIIHMTIGGNKEVYGDRTFTIAISPESYIQIASSRSGIVNNYYIYSWSFPLNTWTKVKVTQVYIDAKYMFTVKIAEAIIITEQNPDPREFQNVKIYLSNAWVGVQPGYIRNLVITNAITDSFTLKEETQIIQNQLVALLYKIPKEYSLSFEFKPTKYKSDVWSSILHLSSNGNAGVYGHKTPAVFISPNSYLTISSAISNDANSSKMYEKILPLEEWTQIKITQIVFETKYIFSIEINETKIYSVENTDAREFQNVKVYFGNPWIEAQSGYIRNLVILNALEKKRNCSLITNLSSSIANEEVFINVNITTSPICLIDLENITIYLRHETVLSFNRYSWDNLGLNATLIHAEPKFLIIYIRKLFIDSYVKFSSVYDIDKSGVPLGKTNASLSVDFGWFEFSLNNMIFKVQKNILYVQGKFSYIDRSIPGIKNSEMALTLFIRCVRIDS